MKDRLDKVNQLSFWSHEGKRIESLFLIWLSIRKIYEIQIMYLLAINSSSSSETSFLIKLADKAWSRLTYARLERNFSNSILRPLDKIASLSLLPNNSITWMYRVSQISRISSHLPIIELTFS